MKNKLIWFSFDPFQKDSKSQVAALKTAAIYAKAISAQIEPVYFADRFRGTDAESYLFPLFPTWEVTSYLKLERAAIKRWEKLIKNLKINTLPLKVITHKEDEAPSLEAKTKALSKAAKRAGVEFIVLQTKANSGLKRLFLGSFAETFLLNSSVPTLLIPPSGAVEKKPNKILYSTDLSASSFFAFKRICPILKDLNSKIVLFYHLEIPQSLHLMLMPSEQKLIDVDVLIQGARSDLEGKAKDFIDLALKYNLKINFKISAHAYPISKAQAILDMSEQLKIDCIALASQSGHLSTSVIGATSRAVLRAASCPVLIYRATS